VKDLSKQASKQVFRSFAAFLLLLANASWHTAVVTVVLSTTGHALRFRGFSIFERAERKFSARKEKSELGADEARRNGRNNS